MNAPEFKNTTASSLKPGDFFWMKDSDDVHYVQACVLIPESLFIEQRYRGRVLILTHNSKIYTADKGKQLYILRNKEDTPDLLIPKIVIDPAMFENID